MTSYACRCGRTTTTDAPDGTPPVDADGGLPICHFEATPAVLDDAGAILVPASICGRVQAVS